MKAFREVLLQGAISIGQFDQKGVQLRQFDLVQYQQETYLVIWHPMHHEFVGSHESGDWISYTELRQSVYIKNLKELQYQE
ncbi:hypothetical protein [Bacillus thuringiensis]|uniref:PBt10-like protein n=1 Tax=Bacillus thuringiensis TaxID=1428 RepID=A0AAW4HZ25_BACTU|nr:hypothetical protein [Bacillus thuringiensis]MBN9901175.1 hypothetical protein [Bacillus thuringiensis]MBN9901340.1 hypothetical protein [Bacillus thuringiensis]MDY7521556.1 hypothetical protein [Bacillus thuringiensis]